MQGSQWNGRKRRKTRYRRFRWGKTLLIAISVGLVVFALVKLVGYGADYASARRTADELRKAYQAETPAPEITAAPTLPPSAVPQATPAPTAAPAAVTLAEMPYPNNPRLEISGKFKTLRKQSRDIVGWLTIGGLLDEAVTQRDEEYYMNHDALGKKNVNGAILVALVLAVMMTLSVCSALAANIKIKSTNEGQTYDIYKLFDAIVDPGRTDGGNGITYKLRSGVTDFKATVNGSDVDGATSWFTLDDGKVTAQNGLNETVLQSDAFKAWAMAYGEKLDAKTVTGDGTDKTISGLADGYYFITTTTGTLVTIDSIGPDEEVQDKNPPTTIDKEIMDSDTAGDTGSVTTDKEAALAQVGRTVEFEVRIPIANGAINYVFEDIMSDGLTLDADSLTVKLADTADGTPGSALAQATYAESQTVANEIGETALDIKIEFLNSWVKANVGKYIVINYNGVVNTNAVIVDASNPNKATIKWGDKTHPLHTDDTVDVWSAKVKVIKVDGENKPLAGAGFVLKNAAGKYYKWDATNGVEWVDNETDATEYITAVEGQGASAVAAVEFKGLANGTYTLHEKTVPNGYNSVADREVTIASAAASIPTLTVEANVTNYTGTELPSTGGIGTTIFYVVGAVLVLGAAAVILARRKAEQQ